MGQRVRAVQFAVKTSGLMLRVETAEQCDKVRDGAAILNVAGHALYEGLRARIKR